MPSGHIAGLDFIQPESIINSSSEPSSSSSSSSSSFYDLDSFSYDYSSSDCINILKQRVNKINQEIFIWITNEKIYV